MLYAVTKNREIGSAGYFRVGVSLTLLLFPSFPLIAYFYRTHGQNNGYNEKQDASDYAGSNSFVLDASRY